MSSALVCVSGGIDSTASLLRCTGEFSEVRAVHVDTRGAGPPLEAVECCRELGVQLIVIPAGEIFRKLVEVPSHDMLQKGFTPNPCAICNAKVKLSLPYSILKPDEFLVTGHYAQFRNGVLARGCDRRKDQSYFLSLVPLEILERCLFPLEGSLKPDVLRELVSSGLPFKRRESQDLCFPLIQKGIPGDIIDTEGNIVGTHTGLEGYTPGQRKGIGAHGERKFVIELNSTDNTVMIGEIKSLYSGKCQLNSINWLQEPAGDVFDCDVQIRYRKPGVPALVRVCGGTAEVVFNTPQKAVSPGQVGALYINNTVLCGGIIAGHEEV